MSTPWWPHRAASRCGPKCHSRRSVEPMLDTVKQRTQGVSELIAFRIGDQEFCVNIMAVREIRGWTTATVLPHQPSYMIGVLNLRGVVLPIVDLSARLGMAASQPTARHVIIVAQIKRKVVGLLVEAVSDILT